MSTEVQVDSGLFVELAIDLDQVRALHPRVVRARWLDEPARVGSRAEILVAIPPSLSLLRPIVGTPRGVLTLVEHKPGQRVRYLLDAARVAGEVQLVADRTGGPSIAVTARLWAKAGLARVAMVPSASVAELLMTRSARRTLARAEVFLARRSDPGRDRSDRVRDADG